MERVSFYVKNIYGLTVILILFFGSALYASDRGASAAVGISVNIGNKTRNIGIFVSVCAYYDFVQFNPGARIRYNFKNLGVPGRYWEFDCYGGLLFAWGIRDGTENLFINSVSNQTLRRYSIAYSYNIYRDGIGTNQNTGTIALHFNNISLITENDIFGDNRDRFRTAAATVQYRHKTTVYGVNLILWTGETGERITETDYPSRKGYFEQGRYGQYSHGILCMQVRQYLDYGQNIQASAGIDAEQVRNFVQNKIMHDMVFLPSKWVNHQSTHVPMLDTDDNLYLYQPDQKIRKPTPYVNAAINPGLFY